MIDPDPAEDAEVALLPFKVEGANSPSRPLIDRLEYLLRLPSDAFPLLDDATLFLPELL